ncbi:MAG: hypothetical protein SFU91_05810 [Chloroherpetonaceae bacterium]|nr:hypothetical protein [Chloroherpetonaceae bacterium]
MSIQEITNAVKFCSVAEKLLLIEFITHELQREVAKPSQSEEVNITLNLIQKDPTFAFLKSESEDGYSLKDLKEQR